MFLKNTLVFRFVHFIRTLSHPEFEEMEDRRDHRLRLRSSICLKRLDIFYKIFSSVLVATEWQNQNFLLTNGSMCLNKTWPWSHHCDNIQKLIKKKWNLKKCDVAAALWFAETYSGDIYSCDWVGPPTGEKPTEIRMSDDFMSERRTKTSHNDSKTVKELKLNPRPGCYLTRTCSQDFSIENTNHFTTSERQKVKNTTFMHQDMLIWWLKTVWYPTDTHPSLHVLTATHLMSGKSHSKKHNNTNRHTDQDSTQPWRAAEREERER